jgi:hypothetical protein
MDDPKAHVKKMAEQSPMPIPLVMLQLSGVGIHACNSTRLNTVIVPSAPHFSWFAFPDPAAVNHS